MRFEWDEEKNRKNLEKHGISFDIACLVFDDPHALTQRDLLCADEEERWTTLGAIGAATVLFVVHTWFDRKGEEIIRLISARVATPRERKTYEEAHGERKARHHPHRRTRH